MENSSVQEPLYVSLSHKIEEEVASDVFKPGDKMYAIGELCEKFQVSTTTAVRCVNLLKVKGVLKSIPRKGTFVSGISKMDLPADSINEELTRIVVFKQKPLIGQLSFPERICRGIMEDAHLNGLSLSFRDFAKSSLSGIDMVPLTPAVDEGIIVISAKPPQALLPLLSASGVRRVVVDALLPYAPCVVTDNRDGVFQVVDYLRTLGHRHIGFAQRVVSPPNQTNENERREAFIHFADGMGLKYTLFGDLSMEDLVGSFLNSGDKPTAMVFTRDDPAVAFMKAVEAVGVKVPEDVSVTGFDDFSLLNADLSGLTTIRVDCEEMGRRASQCLREFTKDTEAFSPWIRVKCGLIARRSAAAPKK